jgi:hypothetical protein
MGDCPTLLWSGVPTVLWGPFLFPAYCFGNAPRAQICHMSESQPRPRLSLTPWHIGTYRGYKDQVQGLTTSPGSPQRGTLSPVLGDLSGGLPKVITQPVS